MKSIIKIILPVLIAGFLLTSPLVCHQALTQTTAREPGVLPVEIVQSLGPTVGIQLPPSATPYQHLEELFKHASAPTQEDLMGWHAGYVYPQAVPKNHPNGPGPYQAILAGKTATDMPLPESGLGFSDFKTNPRFMSAYKILFGPVFRVLDWTFYPSYNEGWWDSKNLTQSQINTLKSRFFHQLNRVAEPIFTESGVRFLDKDNEQFEIRKYGNALIQIKDQEYAIYYKDITPKTQTAR